MTRNILYKSHKFNDIDHFKINYKKANTGLIYSKFFNEWDDRNVICKKNGKKNWINYFIKLNEDEIKQKNVLIKRSIKHQQLLSKQHNGVNIYIKTLTPFVTGVGLPHPVEVGFLWHHSLGVPFLPGSSLKGTIESYLLELMDNKEKEQIKRIFGSSDSKEIQTKRSANVGSVIFLDLLPTKFPKLKGEIITPHYLEYCLNKKAPGDWMKPIPIPFLAVDIKQEFQIVLLPRRKNDEKDKRDVKFIIEQLRNILEVYGLGAKTAVGYGRFKVIEVV